MTETVRPLAWSAALALLLAGCNTVPPATPEQVAGLQGTYSGDAVIDDPALPGPACQSSIHMIDFQVVGNQVHFGGFNGPIRDDGSVELVAGQSWIYGRFEGNALVGSLIIPPTSLCRYHFSLTRGG